jgi:anti-sigma regulatory factor (Ser/Thr protein kinase)
VELFRQIAAGVSAPSSARAAVEVLSQALPDDTYADLRLVVTELVTNCVKHGHLAPDDRVLVTVRLLEDRVRVEVEDCGHGFSYRPTRPPSTDAEGGRGLYIVSRIADRWGVEANDETLVWAELSLTR